MFPKSILKRPVIVFSFIVFVIVAALVGKIGFVSKAETEPQNALLVPAITASNNDTIFTDVDGDGRFDPGDTIQYTVTINNGAAAGAGNDALSVIFSEQLDANTTLVAGSLNASPITNNDTFSVTGNVRIQVPDGASDVLANDFDPDTGNNTGLTASGGATSAQGGNVTMNADGSFSYNPPAGFEGADTYTYTVTDASGATGTGTITFNISGMIWFVNSGAANCTTRANGCGRLTNPYSTMEAIRDENNGTGNNPAASDNIFFYLGSAYTGGLTLLNNQKVIGQGVLNTIPEVTGLTLAPNSDPMPALGGIKPTLQGGITLGQNNTLRGVTVSNNSSGFSLTGNNFGTLTVGKTGGTTDVTINNSQGGGISLNNGTINTFDLIQFSPRAGTNALLLVSVSGGTMNLGVGTIDGASGNTIEIGSAAADSGGNVSVTYNGSGGISKTSAGDVILIRNKTGGSVTFNSNITCNNGCTGITASNNTGGTYTFNGSTKTLNTGASSAVDLSTNTGATFDFTNGGLDIDTTSGTGFAATGGGTVSVTTGANPNTIDSGSGTALNVVNTTIGANGLTFRSIAANGASNGVVLNTTGATGSLSVTGTGTTDGSGGTIQNITNRGISVTSASNLSLKNMTFTNANTVDAAPCTASDNSGCNAPVYMNTVTGATLDNVDINGAVQNGINVREVSNLQILNSIVTNTGAGGQSEEGGLYALNLFGTSAITNSTFSFPAVRGAVIYNTSKTLNLTVSGSQFNDTQTSAVGADGFEISSFGTSNTTVNISNCTFLRDKTNGAQILGENTSTTNVNITGSTVDPQAGVGVGFKRSARRKASRAGKK